MAVTNAVYDGGESKLPQARPTSAVSPAYVDGESGKLPILAYVAAEGTTCILRLGSLATPGAGDVTLRVRARWVP